jgi:phosphoserine / homoserine phosphotransferase
MYIVCADLEGIFTPEVWINVAEKTGISDLRLTTRDISDYDVLMKRRLGILKENGLKLTDIQKVIATLEPLEGALEFLNWIRARVPVVIVSDTFTQFAGPLMEKLGWPALLCNTLSVDPDGSVAGYHLRQKDGKRMAVLSLKNLYYKIISIGDSYNDISMLTEADAGILFNPPENVKEEYPDLPATYTYEEIKEKIERVLLNGSL